jgi:hypothetical protein
MAIGGLTRAALARRLGVSRAWVTKALRHLPAGQDSKSAQKTPTSPFRESLVKPDLFS